MRERFPRKTAGERIGVKTYNRLVGVAERMARDKPGSFQSGRRATSLQSDVGWAPFTQVWAEVSDDQIDDDDTTNSGLYLIKFRYFDHDTGTWKTSAEEYELDVNDSGVTAEIGGKMAVFWHEQRGMFVPIATSGGGLQKIRFKIEDASINPWEALVNITARPCGVAMVSDEVNGQVTIHDPCQCFLDEPAADLIGRCGGAWYADPTGLTPTGTGTADTETGTGTDITACRWEVDWLCCPTC